MSHGEDHTPAFFAWLGSVWEYLTGILAVAVVALGAYLRLRYMPRSEIRSLMDEYRVQTLKDMRQVIAEHEKTEARADGHTEAAIEDLKRETSEMGKQLAKLCGKVEEHFKK